MTCVVIIGAGVAGLAAAFRLLELQPHWEVRVVEQEATPGGLASGWQVGEFSADLGPHRLYTELPEIERLLPELIAREDALTVERRSELLLGGHFFRYPICAGELMRQMGLTRVGTLAVSALLGRAHALVQKPRNYAEAMTQAFGRGVYELIIGPYTQKVWKTPPQDLSAEIARVRVSAGNTNRIVRRLLGAKEDKGRQTALGQFTYVRGGVQNLVRSLTERVQRGGGTVETNWRAVALSIMDDRVVHVGLASTGNAGSLTLPADYVISTMPIPDLVAMANANYPLGVATRAAERLEFVGMILVGVTFHRPQLTPNTWLYFPEEHLVFNRAYEPRNFDPTMAPGDRTMVVFEITARWDSPLWQMPDSQLSELVIHDITRTELARREEIESAACRRIRHAYPIYTRSYRENLAAVCRDLARIKNLLTTGRQGLFNHNNMDHSMLMGIRAAETLARSPEDAARRWYENLHEFDHFRIVD